MVWLWIDERLPVARAHLFSLLDMLFVLDKLRVSKLTKTYRAVIHHMLRPTGE